MSLTFALQALLVRHEHYIAEAEEERRQMAAVIDKLEREKHGLEDENAKRIEENRELLDHLEDLNKTVSSSDAYIHSLATTLKSSRHEIERLTALAAKSTELEAQLLAMETEYNDVQDQLSSSKDDQRSAIRRWRNAERMISTLQDQVDRIEKEANDERERHEEVIARFKRRKAVECELENAAGRLKGAAAATTLGKEKGSSVVSHFVKDILQDNANLQLGIVELREMLMGSNDEVENLREQLLLHQPVLPYNEDGISKSMLKNELARSAAAESLPELHVHHHYHPAGNSRPGVKEKPSIGRRPRNRRNATTAGLLTPTAGLRTPRTRSAHSIRASSPSSATAILSHTSVTIPPYQPLRSKRSSIQSLQNSSSIGTSSVPNSPRSAFRNSSIFDSIDTTMDSSRPTSPDSIGIGSPVYLPRNKRGSSEVSLLNLSPMSVPQGQSVAPLNGVVEIFNDDIVGDQSGMASRSDSMTLDHSTILEEPEEDLPNKPNLGPNSNVDIDDAYFNSLPIRPSLQRSASHESILPIPPPGTRSSLRHKSSQLFAHKAFNSRTSVSISNPTVDPTAVVAQSMPFHSLRLTSSTYKRSLLSGRNPFPSSKSSTIYAHAEESHRPPSSAASQLSSSTASSSTITQAPHSTFSKRVSGWVMGKWGIAPMATTGDLRGKAAAAAALERATGVNQSGRVKGLGKVNEDPQRACLVEPVDVDESALRESLGEG
ncbi:hypothetical protein MMC07_005150 [Pseudocyphellaria aurata]|nr:hypothetical protein [Pseudocyphellaria aurata]